MSLEHIWSVYGNPASIVVEEESIVGVRWTPERMVDSKPALGLPGVSRWCLGRDMGCVCAYVA